MKDLKQYFSSFWQDEDGIGTLEILLIIAVIVVLAIAFRKWIVHWINQIFASTDKGVTDFNSDTPNLPTTSSS